MSDVEWEEVPGLRRPILVAAFEGWFDAGESATAAVEWLQTRYDAPLVASIPAEEYFDFTQRRPEVRLDDDGDRMILWPDNDVHAANVDGHDHDLLLLGGVEPHLRWNAFCDSVLEVVHDCHCALVVTLGAMVAGVPHTRPATVTGSTTNRELAGRLGLGQPTYQGPTGIVGTLHQRLHVADVPTVSLRVGIPHYVAGPPNPKGTMALLQHLEHVTGFRTGWADLEPAVSEWEQRVNAAVADDDDVLEYVRQLEDEVDRRIERDLPSGDDLAAEFERFLRDHGNDS